MNGRHTCCSRPREAGSESPQHIGNIRPILDHAPNIRIVTTFLGMGKMGLLLLPLERCYLLNPGQTLDVGDRHLTCLRPPTFDAPETTALFDTRTRYLFSADSFGALLQRPVASAADVVPEQIRDGLILWTSADSPWLARVDQNGLAHAVDSLRAFSPATILSSHLPPAHGMQGMLFEALRAAGDAAPFVGPDQEALEQAMAGAEYR